MIAHQLLGAESRLYYEAHITVEATESFDQFLHWSRNHGWKASRFDQDEVDAYHGMWFMSQRSKVLSKIVDDTRATVAKLEASGLKIIRWKVEDTILDSKHGDTL